MSSPLNFSGENIDTEKAIRETSTIQAPAIGNNSSVDIVIDFVTSKIPHIAAQARTATLKKPAESTTRPSRRREDIISRRTHIFHLEEEDILRPIYDYKECLMGSVRLRGLAKLDDITNCGIKGISEKKENELLSKEIKKLIEFCKAEGELIYDSQGSLHATNLEGYTNLSNLADQIRCNFNIIKHDNSRILLENCPETSFEAIVEFKSSRKLLLARFAQDKNHVEGREPTCLSNQEDNMKAYHTLVDYIMGIMAWWIIRTADGRNWRNQLLAILAQWAAKLKVIAIDPKGCAERSLGDGEELMRQMLTDLEVKDIFVIKPKKYGSSDSSERKATDVLDEESDIVSTYYASKILLRSKMERIFTWILNSLQAEKFTNKATDSFEMCTLVYKTGLDRTPTLLSGDRDRDISATSRLYHISRSYPLLQLLFENANFLKMKPRILTSHNTEVKWRQSRSAGSGNSEIAKIHVGSLDDIISFLVPLSLTAAIPSIQIGELIQIMTMLADQEDRVAQFEAPPKDFEAEFTIRTGEWLNKQQRLESGRYHDADILPLSSIPLRGGIRAETELAYLMSGDVYDNAPNAAKTRASGILDEYETNSKVMDKWIVGEGSITVDCRVYSRTALGLATAFVLGSMAVPFTIGTKISETVPFQVTAFVWLVAGVLLVVAKSRYVSVWPWHDFLRGQVVCRSVGELSDVSGIGPQMILLYLLHNEYKNTLAVKGPYTGMFKRVSETDSGFIIDEATQLSTMLASGFVIFKVRNEKGEHLICVDLRKGAPTRQILSGQESKYNAVMDYGEDDLEADSSDEDDEVQSQRKTKRITREIFNKRADKVLMLQRQEFRWHTMLGLYVKDSRFG